MPRCPGAAVSSPVPPALAPGGQVGKLAVGAIRGGTPRRSAAAAVPAVGSVGPRALSSGVFLSQVLLEAAPPVQRGNSLPVSR